MILSCPNCGTKRNYREKGPPRATIKCLNCDYRFPTGIKIGYKWMI